MFYELQVTDSNDWLVFSASVTFCRSLHLWSCHLLCHLFRCMINLPSVLSPALKPPPHLLCPARPLLHLMGSISLHCPPLHTKDRYPLTVSRAQTQHMLSAMKSVKSFLFKNVSRSVDQNSGRSPVSPGFAQSQPLRFTTEGGPSKLRPVSITVIQEVCLMCSFDDKPLWDNDDDEMKQC